MPLYLCPVCGHMPSEHGPQGCVGAATVADGPEIHSRPCACKAMINGELVTSQALPPPATSLSGSTRATILSRPTPATTPPAPGLTYRAIETSPSPLVPTTQPEPTPAGLTRRVVPDQPTYLSGPSRTDIPRYTEPTRPDDPAHSTNLLDPTPLAVPPHSTNRAHPIPTNRPWSSHARPSQPTSQSPSTAPPGPDLTPRIVPSNLPIPTTLARPTAQVRPNQTTLTGGMTPPMGIMDQINQGAPAPQQRLSGNFAKAQDRASLWVNKIPFEISSVPQNRRKNERFIEPNKDPNEWVVEIRLLEMGSDGVMRYQMQDDGEGGQAPVQMLLSLSAGPTRNYQMQRFGEWVAAHGSCGPLRLDKGQAQGDGAPPWIFVDWTPPAQPSYATPMYQAPAAPVVPVPPPAPVETMAPPPPPPAEQPYQYTEDGKHRWRPGMANWEPVPAEPQGTQAQPLPAPKVMTGLVNSEGMPSERVTVVGADGSQMRQAIYQGEGRVEQPSGYVTQNAAPEAAQMNPSGQAAQTPATAPQGAIGVEPQATPSGAAPSTSAAPAGTSNAYRANYEQGRAIPVTLGCPSCGNSLTASAFKRPQQGDWAITHVCAKAGKTLVLNATEAVKSVAGVA